MFLFLFSFFLFFWVLQEATLQVYPVIYIYIQDSEEKVGDKDEVRGKEVETKWGKGGGVKFWEFWGGGC